MAKCMTLNKSEYVKYFTDYLTDLLGFVACATSRYVYRNLQRHRAVLPAIARLSCYNVPRAISFECDNSVSDMRGREQFSICKNIFV